MKLLFTSDLHGTETAFQRFSELLSQDRYDAGVMAGDLMTYLSRAQVERLLKSGAGFPGDVPEAETIDADANREASLARALKIREAELKAILKNAGKPVVFIMGNDDGILADGVEWTAEHPFYGANMQKIAFGDTNFIGYQYTNPFIGGRYEKGEEEQEADFSALDVLIDEKTILVTHGPAFGILDRTALGRSVGSRALLRLIERRPPRWHLFGHVHESFGVLGHAINGSYPKNRQFVSIETTTRETTFVD